MRFAEAEAKQQAVQSHTARTGPGWDSSPRFLDSKACTLPATFRLQPPRKEPCTRARQGPPGAPHTPIWAVGPTARVPGPGGKKGGQMAGYVIRPVKYGQGRGRALQRGLGRAPEVSAPGPARPQPGSSTHSRAPHGRPRSEASAHLVSAPRALAFGLRRHGNHSPGRRGCDVTKAAHEPHGGCAAQRKRRAQVSFLSRSSPFRPPSAHFPSFSDSLFHRAPGCSWYKNIPGPSCGVDLTF